MSFLTEMEIPVPPQLSFLASSFCWTQLPTSLFLRAGPNHHLSAPIHRAISPFQSPTGIAPTYIICKTSLNMLHIPDNIGSTCLED